MMTSVIDGGEIISMMKQEMKEGIAFVIDASESGCIVEVKHHKEFGYYRFQIFKTNGKLNDDKRNMIAEWWTKDEAGQ